MDDHSNDSRLAEAISRAEQVHGVVVPGERAATIIGSRTRLLAAEKAGAIPLFGRRGGSGNRTYLVADLIRYLHGGAQNDQQPQRAAPIRNARDVRREVADAAAEAAALAKGGAR